jgi:5-methylcytosine-specific restriction endonuclease McrA
VSEMNPKRPRLRLEPEAYRELRHRVLERDGWRCQNCGAAQNLQVHHIERRSKLGSDTCDNLIALCAQCHASIHKERRRIP